MEPTEPSSPDATGARTGHIALHTFCCFDGDKASARAITGSGLVDPHRSVLAAFAIVGLARPRVLAAAIITAPTSTREIHADLITGLLQREAPGIVASNPDLSIQQVKLTLRGPEEPTSADLLRLLVGQRARIEALTRR